MKGNIFGLLLMFVSFGAYAGDAIVSWDAPLQYEDGTTITAAEIQNYKIYYGQTDGGPYNFTVTVAGNVNSATVTGLGKGNWYFVATTVATNGLESAYSNQATKTVQGTSKPRPPRNVR